MCTCHVYALPRRSLIGAALLPAAGYEGQQLRHSYQTVLHCLGGILKKAARTTSSVCLLIAFQTLP